MRAFIAVDLPDGLKKVISGLQSELKKENVFSGNWASGFHITLKFLGEVGEDKLDEIKRILETICKKVKKFDLELKGLGAFPSENYVRVIFVKISEGDEPAMFLQRQIDTSIKKENFLPGKPKKKQSFFLPQRNEVSPENYKTHITLIRVKSVSDKSRLKNIFESYKNKSFGRFAVGKITLIKSTLTPEGPIYENIKEFALA